MKLHTASAIQAKALRACLADPDNDDLSRRYFCRVAKRIAPIWQGNRLNDFAVIPVHGWRAIPQRILNWQLDKVMAAASNDIEVTEVFLRTLGLVESPNRLFRPSMLWRVLKGSRRSRHHGQEAVMPGYR